MSNKSICYFCNHERELRNSHIIPKFVVRWMKSTTDLGIRSTKNINRRIQDTDKAQLLCDECESVFGKWENEFAKSVFQPLHDDKRRVLYYNYEKWGLKFAVSVSWRVLLNFKLQGFYKGLTLRNQVLCDEALTVWKEFLQGNRKHPGQFEQHMFPINLIESYEGLDISPYFNRYATRSIEFDIIDLQIEELDEPFLVFVKMGRIVLFGVIHYPNIKGWRGTKLHVNKGEIGSAKYEIEGVFVQYLNYKATELGEAIASMSRRQHEVVRNDIEKNQKAYLKSEHALAFAQDIQLSGRAAIDITKESQESKVLNQ